MCASVDGHLELAKLLLDAGADVNACDSHVSLHQQHCSLAHESIMRLRHQHFFAARATLLILWIISCASFHKCFVLLL